MIVVLKKKTYQLLPHEGFVEDTLLFGVGQLKNDLAHGKFTYFRLDKTKTIQEEVYLSNGKREGVSLYHFLNGQYGVYFFKNDMLQWHYSTDKEGRIIELHTYKDGFKHGWSYYYNDLGEIRRKEKYKKGKLKKARGEHRR